MTHIEDAIDPALVPQRTLYTGARMPAIGLGTFGSDHISPVQVAAAVEYAGQVGYRHFDCAAVYANEAAIGRALARLMESGIRRQDLWITSKLWNDKHAPADVIPACRSLTSVSNISTAISCTGRFQISIRPDAMLSLAARMPARTSTKTSCVPGARWSVWSN